jgi:endonuclease/exonuclease/phosphatase family metal-dependent hydrolase
VTTTDAPSRRFAGTSVPPAVAELALPALTVVMALQLLRLMVATVVAVQRDRLGASLASLALFAGAVVGLGLLAGPVARGLGRGRALVLTAAGVALVRLAVQLVPDALVRWLLAPVGVVLFLWFVALWLARDGRGFGLALLAGLAADTALHGLGGSWDYAWSTAAWAVALAGVVSGAALWALAALPGPGAGRAPAGGAVTPLAGIGPALFLQVLIWQNLGWQAVLGGRSQAQAFLLVMLANLGALAAGTAAGGRAGWPLTGAALAGLAAAVALGEPAPAAASLLGQAAAAVQVVGIVDRATTPAGPAPGGAAPGGPGSGGPGRGGRGLGAVAGAWTAGMGLFLLLMFVYYAAYDLVLPFSNRWLPAVAAGLLGLAGVAATWGRRPARRVARSGPRRRDLVPLAVGVALLAVPVLSWASTPRPLPAAGPPPAVRLLSYNLHFGFDVRGWSDLEATARAIEASGAEVVGLQEVSRGWYINGATDMLAWLQRRLRMPHARFAGASDAVWGNAVLSRHPILAAGTAALPRQGVPLARNYLWVELALEGGQRLRVVVTHLHHVEGPAGAAVRLAQLPPLLEAAAGRPATVLLGDLNAEPGSAEIAMVRAAGLVDAFAAGGGRPADEPTWPSDRPRRRIDYLWLSGDLEASDFAATPGTASDHRGVAVTLRPR